MAAASDPPPVDWEAVEACGLYDPRAPDAAERRALLEYLVGEGVTLDDMLDANRQGRLAFAAGDVRIRPGRARHTLAEAAARVGLDEGMLVRFWRASGFPAPALDAPAFSDADLQALELLTLAIARFGEEPALQLVRVMGASLARMATAGFQTALVHAENSFAPRATSVLAAARASTELAAMAEISAPAIDVLFRHHLAAAAHWSDLTPTSDPETAPLAVGFADLVGFTSLSRVTDVHDLARAVTAFDALTSEIVGDCGGRVVKLIGDEVMFAAPGPRGACAIALALADALRDHPVLPRSRAAVAAGTVLVRDGDCFGPVVNLASRLVHLAAPGDVIVPAGTVAAGDGVVLEPLGTRNVRGFGEPVAIERVCRDREVGDALGR